MWRLHLPADSFDESGVDDSVITVGINRQHEVESLLHGHPEGAYAPQQLERGIFCGIENRGKLVSVVGTHVLSSKFRIAAVGNAFTHPEYRGRGYYRSCLAAVIKRLRSMGITDIIANVIQENQPSLSGASSLGFVKHCPYWEGIGVKH